MQKIFSVFLIFIFGLFFALIFVFSFEANKNYKAGRSGPFTSIDVRKSGKNKVRLAADNLRLYFLSRHRADEVSKYLVEKNGFNCTFSSKFFVLTQVKQVKNGSTMICNYRFDGLMYVLSENFLLFISFDENFYSIDFNSMINYN
jgi:hypothetical protein